MEANPSVAVDLNQLLQSLLSANNEARSAAEALLESEWRLEGKVALLLTFLAENAANGTNDTVKSFSAVLFRRIAIRSPKEFSSLSERTIGVLDESSKERIRAIVLQGFVSDQSNQVRRKLADCISEIAKEDASPKGRWPELLPALFQAAVAPDPSFRESAYRILSTLPEIIEKDLAENLVPTFISGFDDENDDVRIAACIAYVSFFRELPKAVWQRYTPLLPSLLNSLPKFLNNGQDLALANVLESLIDLVEIVPKMFKDMFPTIIEFCSSVSKNRDLDLSARLAALELLTTFAEVSPAMCKQSGIYAAAMVLIDLQLLTEVSQDDDEAAEWNNDSNTDEDDEEPEYDAARQSLDRVSLKLGGQSLAGPLFQYLPEMCCSSQWRECFAALMALSSAAEGCVDVLITELPKLLDMVLPTLDHPHPRVQYACCNALGQMSTDFADVVQRTSGERILPALISKLTNKSVPRVQAHAAAALVNFSEAASKDALEPYLDTLLNNLVSLLESPKRYVQEQVLTTIAIIADAAEQRFIKYHTTLLPMLLGFLKTDLGPENRMLTGKCIECATLIALAVGRDNFSPYCPELIQVLGAIQESISDVDDPVKSFLEQGWGRICRIIGADFIPYMPLVLPTLLGAAKAAQDISLLEEEEAEEFNNNEEWDVINLGGKLIAVHTAALDDKVSALDLLRLYATQLKGLFLPWVKEITQDIAIPALDFYLHDGVRASAALTLAALFKSTIYATSAESAETSEIWSQICSKISEVLKNEPMPEVMVAYYSAIIECLGSLPSGVLSDTQLTSLAEGMNVNLNEVYGRISLRDDLDDEYAEDVNDEDEEFTDEELLDEINKTIGSLFRVSREKFLIPFETSLLPLAKTFLFDDNTTLKLCALGMLCDVFEQCGSSFAQGDFLKYIISDCLTSSNASIRQAAAYAIGVASSNGESAGAQICIEALPTLFEIATYPDARADENVAATENCVACIAKISRAFGSLIPALDQLITQWVALLPVLQDTEAATSSYEFLLDLGEGNHPAILNQRLKAAEALLQALSHKSITGQAATRASNLAKSLLSVLPREEAISVLRGIGDESLLKDWLA